MQQYLVENAGGELVRMSKDQFVQLLLDRAEESLEVTRALTKDRHWAGACFWSCTAAGQALESYLIYAGGKRGESESAGAMAQMCAEFDPGFSGITRTGKYLDRYYAITRYPDTLPYGAVPYKWFNADDAKEAIEYAAEIVNFVRARLPMDGHEPDL